MKFYEDFIGEEHSNCTEHFIGGDSKEQFNSNLPTQSEDWYYRDKQITYTFNKHGHRCKNINELDLDNYILISGCSHTQGVGLELETTYAYRLSKKLGCDYYNIAISASGADVVQHNVLNWTYTIPKKPKLIVIQWPDHSRFLSYNYEYKNLIPKGTWQEDVTRFIVNCEDYGAFFARKKLTTELLSNVLQVPVIRFNYGGQVGYDSDPIKMRKLDVARDLSHSGIKSHEAVTDMLYTLAIERMGLLLP
jgi:hypothetical protein